MKPCLLIVGFLLSQLAYAGPAESRWQEWLAKNTHPVSDVDAGDDYSDLASFGAAIKDAQIVLLDEQSHGEENVFALKSRLVRYLHEKQGFDVLVMESGLYDVDRIWRTADAANTIRKQAPGNLFFMYANSAAVQHLLDYIQERKNSGRPLILSGMDSQHTGSYSSTHLLGDLCDTLDAVGSRLPADEFWPVFSELTVKLFLANRGAPDPSLQKRYFSFIDRLKASFPPTSDYFWYRVVLSMENQAQRYWGLRSEQRSGVMGGNLKALIRYRYPGKKIIVWGQYVHLNRAGLPIGGNVGYAIAKQFRQKAYVAHFTGNKGTYYNFFNDQDTPVVRFPFKSIENLLERQPGPYNFTNWRELPPELRKDETILASMFHYFPDGLLYMPQSGLPRWHKQVDGTFFLDKITSPRQ